MAAREKTDHEMAGWRRTWSRKHGTVAGDVDDVDELASDSDPRVLILSAWVPSRHFPLRRDPIAPSSSSPSPSFQTTRLRPCLS